MPVVQVQLIRSTWTKASRGHPGSVARAAVPEALPMDAHFGAVAAPVVVETVGAEESEGFALVRSTEGCDELPLLVGNVGIADNGDGAIGVTRRAEARWGWPSRARDATAMVLPLGKSCRLIRNFRHSGYRGWSYEKLVVNVAYLPAFSVRAFVDGEPDAILDEQGSLF